MKSVFLNTKQIIVFLLGITCVLNMRFIWVHLSTQSPRNQQAFSYRGHDRPNHLPIPVATFPTALMTVEESVHYPVLGSTSDKVWSSITSSSYGYIRLGPEHRLFDTSMSHELHCLRVLNLALGESHIPETKHIQHCLNYIRQGILCDSDLTLEPGDFEERDLTVEKVGATYVCRDWSLWYNVMGDHDVLWSNITSGLR
ncbi:hypothetical protein QCA50_008573 [Cerrena zonata]|uniref:Oxidase ustYa n=1 Tax=Cerrena zonata TaxID=2478898 RepID=A0AAW0GDX4_9APHY